MGGADVQADGHPSMATVGLDGERLGWSGWVQQRANGHQVAARTPIGRQHGAQRRYQTHTHRPSLSPWPIQTVQRAYPSVRIATCSEVEEAVSQHDHRRDEGRLMIRGSRSMVRERMYGDVWSRVARVDRWVDLLCFSDVMSLIGCVGARVGGALSGRR